MAKIINLIVVFNILLIAGCYSGITAKIIDAETNQPIEGAIVLVEWTKTHGYGLTSTDLFFEQELVTTKDGMCHLKGVDSFLVNQPRVTVYKKGYVTWNNKYIFPGWEMRKDFKWEDGVVIKLWPFRSEYSESEHELFFQGVTHWGEHIQKEFSK